MRILLVESDRTLARTMEVTLVARSCSVEVASTGGEALALSQTGRFDLILMDLELPDMAGLALLRGLRLARVRTPLMILTASAAVDTKVKALAGGADDYVVRPFNTDELIARIKAAVRRCGDAVASTIRVGDLVVDLAAKTVDVAGAPTHLTGREYQLVELLALRRGKTISKDAVLTSLYGAGDEPDAKIIDVFVCKIRRKLAQAGGDAAMIRTIWGGGYLMPDPDRVPLLQAA